jgi:hypothetical protein
MPSTRSLPLSLFLALAAALLVMTIAWHVPMMLWDHLDLVPMLEALQQGNLLHSDFMHFHGGHLHTAAYVVLLLTTTLSAGRPWLDCVTSWMLLLAYAFVVFVFVRETFPGSLRRDRMLSALAALLALYPGHLANLQWGWQVAVFLCLAGIAMAIHALTRAALSWPRILVAFAGAALAYFSFATAIAIFPVALVLIALRHDVPHFRRMAMALPWVGACAVIAIQYAGLAPAGAARHPLGIAFYVLNFLGAGIARFATDLAPWLAVAAIVLAAWAAWREWRTRTCLPWLGLLLFTMLASVLAALGRESAFGDAQAFVTRYVSFSSMFWLGWVGLVGGLYGRSHARVARVALYLVALFACANALHMIHKAAEVGVRTRTIARTIRDTWPQVDYRLLGEIYFGRPQVAQQRLARLHDWGYAPFDRPPTPPQDTQVRRVP